MKLLMENWREYLKEETVDEIRNPFRKQDIGGPRKKKTKEADISFDDIKRFWRVHNDYKDLIFSFKILEKETPQPGGRPLRYDQGRRHGKDLSKKLADYQDSARDLFKNDIVPLVDQLAIVRRQIDKLGFKWPREMDSEEVAAYVESYHGDDIWRDAPPVNRLDVLLHVLSEAAHWLKMYHDFDWESRIPIDSKAPKFPEVESIDKLFKLTNRAKGNATPDAYPDHRITRTDWAPHRALTTTKED